MILIETKKWDVCFWLGYTKDINFTIDWDSGFTFKVSFIFFQAPLLNVLLP